MISGWMAKDGEVDILARLETTGNGWRIVGDMNFASVPVLLVQGRNLLDFGSILEIDMTGVSHADSAGLALMLEWMDLFRSAGGAVHFRNIPTALLNVARVSNVSELISSGDLPATTAD